MRAHTPGPWELETFPDNGAFVIRGNSPQPYGEDMVITKRDIGTVDPEEGAANARLIAAAPDLLEACKEFVRKCDSGQARSVRSYAQMKAAIAKAEGK